MSRNWFALFFGVKFNSVFVFNIVDVMENLRILGKKKLLNDFEGIRAALNLAGFDDCGDIFSITNIEIIFKTSKNSVQSSATIK